MIVCDVCGKMYIFVHLIMWKVEYGALVAIPLTFLLNLTFQCFQTFHDPVVVRFPDFLCLFSTALALDVVMV